MPKEARHGNKIKKKYKAVYNRYNWHELSKPEQKKRKNGNKSKSH